VRSGLQAQHGILRVNGKSRSGRRRSQGCQGRTEDARSQEASSTIRVKYQARVIFGHSCQAVAVLTQALASVFALPLACRIHEGTVFSNRDKRTLLDKMILLLDSLGLSAPFYFVGTPTMPTARRFAACWTRETTSSRGSRATACLLPGPPQPANRPRLRGRPQVRKQDPDRSSAETDRSTPASAQSRLWRAGVTLRFRSADLFLATRRDPRPLRRRIASSSRHHPADVYRQDTVSLDIIRIYGLRFKIELSFSRRSVSSAPIAITSDGGHDAHKAGQRKPVLHRKPDAYRNAVRRKIAAYHRHIQLGIIARASCRYSPQPIPD